MPWPYYITESGDRRARAGLDTLALTRLKAERSGITSAEHSCVHEEHSAVCPGLKEGRMGLDTLALTRLKAERSGITSAQHSRNHEEHSAVCPGLKEGRTVISTRLCATRALGCVPWSERRPKHHFRRPPNQAKSTYDYAMLVSLAKTITTCVFPILQEFLDSMARA